MSTFTADGGWEAVEVETFPTRRNGRPAKLDGLIKILLNNPGHIFRVYHGTPTRTSSKASSLRSAIKRLVPEMYNDFVIRTSIVSKDGSGAVFASYGWTEEEL